MVRFRSSLRGYVEACDHDAKDFRHWTGLEDVIFAVKRAWSESGLLASSCAGSLGSRIKALSPGQNSVI